ncbi:MAG: LysE family translocator [Geminicoccaceae bacterium]
MAIVIVPGPTITVIVANSLRHGARAGLLNIAGTQAGLLVMLAVLAAGLSTIIDHMGSVFDWVRLIGAAYLIWLGVKLWRSDGRLEAGLARDTSDLGFFWQGLLVIWSNPKALLFFGAFIPQFIDPNAQALSQILVLGLIFMVVATLLDTVYAFAAGQAGDWLSAGKVRYLERISGSFLIGGGVWLALSRRF